MTATAMPNRISAFGHLTPQRELALAQELLELQSEEELDNFIPLILPALKLAAPLLKGVAGSLLGGLTGGGDRGGRRARRPRGQQEYFLGNIVRGLFGEIQPENEEEERFLGRILKGLLGERELQGEEEQFLGGLIGKLFGGRREMEAETGMVGEAENYVQEQFLGGLIGKLFRGRREMEAFEAEVQMEEEAPGAAPSHWRLRLARRFVRLAHAASRRAAQQMAALGRRPTVDEARRIVLGSIIAAARRFTPRLASAFGIQGAPPQQPLASNGGGAPPAQELVGEWEGEWAGQGEGEGTMLEVMLAGPRAASARGGGHGPERGYARWVRRGDRLVISF